MSQEHTNLPIPTILEKHVLNSREFVVVEKLVGNTVQSFIEQPDSILFSLGKGLAEIHKFKADFIGNPSGTFQVPLDEFQPHILNVSKELVNMFYSDDESIKMHSLPLNHNFFPVRTKGIYTRLN